ncbi:MULTISPECIES: NEW3 domain-containing protein [unclassified Mycolicibacterium]|uniref:glycoside hydrolase family 38 N-terminal domain-containing protein n=1 Tax=unclassified Mycolicibacterium TaxID=2636767 RepID=UPI002ED8E707
MRVIAAESTELFIGSSDLPVQLARVTYTGCTAATTIRVDGDGLSGQAVADAGDGVVEVPVTVRAAGAGDTRAAVVDGLEFEFTVAEPGWTMYMISHFHYDPVWWNTQAAYTSVWTEDPPGQCRQTNGFDLVAAHLEMARREPEYKFVLAEVDYLKPYWDAHPEDRADLRRFIADGRVEIMGGAYNEPNTNLTSPETAIRNFVAGTGFQRDVLGANPATAWQLDVFGHDPQFPGIAADAGLTSSSWARGPHHQWGPMQNDGDPERMQFASEFEWIAPSGRGLLTHYMPAHYSAGWWMDSAATLTDAEESTYRLFSKLKRVALTRNVLLPVGTDYTPPNKWVTQIHRDWNARYVWPRFVCALPSEFFAAVRAELDSRGVKPSPQTRDMNPIYTGKDVSYIDTKQANRAAEDAVLDAERFAVFAGLLGGADYPQAALSKAWVQLAYGAHHDAITGSESDQVYLDLLTGWRDAWELGRAARDNALQLLSDAVDGYGGQERSDSATGSIVVWNPLAHNRTDVVTVHLDQPLSGVLVDTDGSEVPVLVEHGGRTVSWLARDVPSLGWRAYRFTDGSAAQWEPLAGCTIENDHYRLTVDPARGGGVVSLLRAGRELLADGAVGNELAVYDEYPAHPQAGEGPWHLLPKGPVVCSSGTAADEIYCQHSTLGQRVTVRGGIDGLLRYTQTITLWHGLDRVDCRTTIDDFTGSDKLLRLRWPCPVPGALPVSEVGDAVIGRGFGLMHDGEPTAVDSAQHPWTLDNPAYSWFGLSSAVRIKVANAVRAVSVAEVVTPDLSSDAVDSRELVVALVRAGVTATCSSADKPRYGNLAVDSNLPDTRLSLGGPSENSFTAAVLAASDDAYGNELKRQLDATGSARVWVPAATPLREQWVPDADLRAPRALPVLILAGDLTAVVDDLADAEIIVDQHVPTVVEAFEQRTVAVLNRGIPGFAVGSDGTLHTSLMRSCTGWPSGTWIDPPRRTTPDGSNFQLQHWTHTFDYAVVAGDGDWRAVGVCARGAEFNRPLRAVTTRRSHAGGLPAWGSLLEIEPAGHVQLAALKPTGNPLASGSVRPAEPAGGITARLVETAGRTTDVKIRSGLRCAETTRTDLLEQPRVSSGSRDKLRLNGFEIATVSARLNLPRVLRGEHCALAPEAEVAQPLYARYWLHNRGPAPLGGLPAVAHLHPENLTVTADSPVVLRLTAASDCTDAPLHGRVRVIVPPGWTAEPAELPFVLPPDEHLETEVAVGMPAGVAPGVYPIRAELVVTGTDAAALPPSWRQVVEDICLVTIGEPGAAVLKLCTEPQDVEVKAGDSGQLSIEVGTDARAGLSAEAHLISPWGTWDWMGPAAVGFELPAGGTAQIGFDVSPPDWVEPGQWWTLIRVGCAGRLLYTPAVRVVVR